jgi:hypothetical protein
VAMLTDHLPQRRIFGYEPGPGADPYDPAQTAEHLEQRVALLSGFLGQQGEVRSDHRPLIVTYNTGAGFEVSRSHTTTMAAVMSAFALHAGGASIGFKTRQARRP